MTRTRARALSGVALSALVLLAVVGTPGSSPERAARADVAALRPAAHVAALPARVGDDTRGATAGAPRVLVLAAVLGLLFGLPGLLRRTAYPSAAGSRPLRARRHTISLRAPPALPV